MDIRVDITDRVLKPVNEVYQDIVDRSSASTLRQRLTCHFHRTRA